MIHFFIYIFLNLQYIIHSIPLSLQQVVGWHQNAPESTKDWLKKVAENARSHMHLSWLTLEQS